MNVVPRCAYPTPHYGAEGLTGPRWGQEAHAQSGEGSTSLLQLISPAASAMINFTRSWESGF